MPSSLPRDDNGIAMQLTPARVANATAVNASISSSTAITFAAGSAILRAYAISQDVYLKWGTTAVTSSNFDEVIPAGQVVDLIIPQDSTSNATPKALYTGCTIIERTATATLITIEKK